MGPGVLAGWRFSGQRTRRHAPPHRGRRHRLGAAPGRAGVWAHGQGGLLDLALSPDFASDQRVYFSYSEPGPGASAGTAVAHGTLGVGGLSDVRVIFRQQPKLSGPNHFGSRLAFDRQGRLFVTLGERNDRTRAQRLDGLQGKVVRINADGSIPADNPFVGKAQADPAI